MNAWLFLIEIFASCLTIKHDANLFIKLLRTYSYLFQIKVCAANVQERLVFKKDFFILIFAAINQERLLFESVHYWRGYGKLNFIHDMVRSHEVFDLCNSALLI